MRTDTELRIAGIQVLVDALGTVEAERFIALILREPFDYTAWRRGLWEGMAVEQLSAAATRWRRTEASPAD